MPWFTSSTGNTGNTNAGADWVYLFAGSGERIAKFPAKATVLRREMARYIAEANALAKGWTVPDCTTPIFADVPCSDPDSKYVNVVYQKGVTAGCNASPLQYCPDSTLTRAQMSVFLVKGYKADGFAPPPCQGTFQDVTCTGPFAAFAPWIEQLHRDGVTAGCGTSPLRFCPANAVGEWEMLVWLARAPGAAPGSSFWASYHPVPRGAIYTLRDDSNRIVTEMAGGSSGASTATLSVTRDNVFLGNLLVASWVASPAGWQYSTSDHLGSPRLIFNQARQIVETHKYWPYGEDTTATPPGQRLAYALMERDTEGTRFYDHARNHDHVLGRFLTPDRVGGAPESPQSWNRYAYTRNNPLRFVDPSGLDEVDVHQHLTTTLALAAGISAPVAARIGSADQGVDEDPNTAPTAGSTEETRRLYHFTTAERRDELWNSFERSGSPWALGVYFHAQQDSFSHEGFGPGVGHLFAGHAPDKTYNDPTKAYAMAKDTYTKLAAAAPLLPGQSSSLVAWSVLEPYVRAFAAAKTAEEKDNVLGLLRRRIEQERKNPQPRN